MAFNFYFFCGLSTFLHMFTQHLHLTFAPHYCHLLLLCTFSLHFCSELLSQTFASQLFPYFSPHFCPTLLFALLPCTFELHFSLHFCPELSHHTFASHFSLYFCLTSLLHTFVPPKCFILLITPFQMLNFHQSVHSKIGLIIIILPKAPLHPVTEYYSHHISITKLTQSLNEPIIMTCKIFGS